MKILAIITVFAELINRGYGHIGAGSIPAAAANERGPGALNETVSIHRSFCNLSGNGLFFRAVIRRIPSLNGVCPGYTVLRLADCYHSGR